MLRINGRKKTVAIAAACALIAAAGAYAYWSSTGTGTGTATSETYEAITINQTSPITGLYPGGPAVTLSGNFDNPNQGSVKVAAVTVAFNATTPITGGGGAAPCTAADYVLGGSATPTNAVPTGNGVGAWTGLTIRMVDSVTNQDACKAATVNLTYSSS
jgi:hypothetical protein